MKKSLLALALTLLTFSHASYACEKEDVQNTSKLIATTDELNGQPMIDFTKCALPIAEKLAEEYCDSLPSNIERSKLTMSTDEVTAYIKRSKSNEEDKDKIYDCSNTLKKLRLLKTSRENAEKEVLIDLQKTVLAISKKVLADSNADLSTADVIALKQATQITNPLTPGLRNLAITILKKRGL